MLDQKQMNANVNGSQKAPKSIDCSQAELMQARYFRMSEELQQHWKSILMQLIAEAESMIDENHYASSDVGLYLPLLYYENQFRLQIYVFFSSQLKNKVDQMVMTQRDIDDGLKKYNRWILQILDLLLLKREISKFMGQTTVQQARIEAIQLECSTSVTHSKYPSCDRLESSLDVSNMLITGYHKQIHLFTPNNFFGFYI